MANVVNQVYFFLFNRQSFEVNKMDTLLKVLVLLAQTPSDKTVPLHIVQGPPTTTSPLFLRGMWYKTATPIMTITATGIQTILLSRQTHLITAQITTHNSHHKVTGEIQINTRETLNPDTHPTIIQHRNRLTPE